MSWTLFAKPILDLIDKVIPDADAREKAKADVAMLEAKGELDAILGQIQINIEEAKHPSVFVSGWRPFVGWVGASALGYAAILEPLLRFGAQVGFGYSGSFPAIDTAITLQILMALLGFGGYRAYEKGKGVASK